MSNWIVASPKVAESMVVVPAPEPEVSSLGIQYLGKDKNQRRVYKDRLFTEEKVLVGYKGESYMDSGYFYAPYIPITRKPVVLDPNSFEPRRGILTRYGRKLLRERAEFYKRVRVARTEDFGSVSTTLELK